MLSVSKAFGLKCIFVYICVCTAALALCSEAYFSAVAKMGDQALHTLSSRSLGECVSVSVFPLQVSPQIYYIHYRNGIVL